MSKTPEGGVLAQEAQLDRDNALRILDGYQARYAEIDRQTREARVKLWQDLEQQDLIQKIIPAVLRVEATEAEWIPDWQIQEMKRGDHEKIKRLATEVMTTIERPIVLRVQALRDLFCEGGYRAPYLRFGPVVEVRPDRKEIITARKYAVRHWDAGEYGSYSVQEDHDLADRNEPIVLAKLQALGYKDMRGEIQARTEQLAEEYTENPPPDLKSWLDYRREYIKEGQLDRSGFEKFLPGQVAEEGLHFERQIRRKAMKDAVEEFLTRK